MVTQESGDVRFECDRSDLPLCTRVVHHQPAEWDRESDRMVGFIDNQAGSAAGILQWPELVPELEKRRAEEESPQVQRVLAAAQAACSRAQKS